MARVTGIATVSRKMKGLAGPDTIREVAQALFVAGDLVKVDAQVSLTKGAVSGKNHVPSAPGEPPNQDTGFLGNHIETTVAGPLKVVVSSNAAYSAALEFGTSKMAARPFMKPAAQQNRRKAQALVTTAINRAIRRAGR